MQKFTTLTATAAPLDLINIDTDMIIPKQFLKTIERTGLGKNLFHEMRFDLEGKEIADLSPSADAFNESGYRGIGFGLGVAVTLDPARVGIPGSAGEFAWGGMASTAFFVDPKEDMAVVFMTQVITDTARRAQLRRDLRSLIYDAMTERAACAGVLNKPASATPPSPSPKRPKKSRRFMPKLRWLQFILVGSKEPCA